MNVIQHLSALAVAVFIGYLVNAKQYGLAVTSFTWFLFLVIDTIADRLLKKKSKASECVMCSDIDNLILRSKLILLKEAYNPIIDAIEAAESFKGKRSIEDILATIKASKPILKSIED